MAYTEFYCDPSGSNLNSGSSTATTAAYTAANGDWGTAGGANTYTPTDGSTPASFVSVGDFASVYLDAATVAVYIARVTAVAAGVNGKITLSSTAKSGTAPTTGATGRSIKVGGCWKGPNGAESFPFNFITSTATDASANVPRVNYKNNSTYSVTSTVSFNKAGPLVHEGYTTAAGDGGRAVIDGGTSGSGYILFSPSGTTTPNCVIKNIIFQNNGATGSSAGVSFATGLTFVRCVVNSVRGTGFRMSGAGTFASLIECEAYSCNQSNTANTVGFSCEAGTSAVYVRCVSHDNTGSNNSGWYLSGNAALFNCVSETNGKYGFNLPSGGNCFLYGCVAYNNTSDGLNHASSSGTTTIENSAFVSNGGYGVNQSAGIVILNYLAFYSNTSGQTNGTNASFVTGSVTLTGDPFTASSTGNFTLNNTAGAGAACRGAGIGTYTQTAASYTGTVGYPDIGAAQHQDAGGGGSNVASGARIFTGF